ncbi:hypothetical protein TUN199_10940 [Pyrenophora tritici-repentis]|nr:hypothetical protein Alg130_09563 [Pyrenophora tritici-repentis]KAI0617069.1 hypothetical protein TUN199_10940 [Pyrenophora tritici-repentis]KAI1527774.1 hypothetical protein PtrSN001A_009285 [Pyrenophora tritici-repentis]KAI1528721.1 hypothetical protein PtrSN001C_009366 [Pyrenophora tritici-repentis]KAI1566467.1 hypothetical protein PtrEW7m1_009544 [Pyrenophora tritici-repentis]
MATSHPPATVASVVISYPALPGLYAEDISDVGHYLSLPLLNGNHVYPPRSIVSAYAGYGMGLCKSYIDEAQCRKEGLTLPVRPTLFIEYTSTSLLLHLASMREAYDLADPETYTYPYFFRPGDPTDPDSEKRIRQLRVCIIMLLHRRYATTEPPKLITVLLTGESATSAAAEAVDGAVKSAGFQIELFGPTYPEFTVARGANLYQYNSQGDCAPQPAGYGPHPTPDTPGAFYDSPAIHSFAFQAPIPKFPTAYALAFSLAEASYSDRGYLGHYELEAYSPDVCAAHCNAYGSERTSPDASLDHEQECKGFNIYFERSPSIHLGPEFS